MPPAPQRLTPRQRFAALLPAALLLVVAANQVRLVHQHNLTPWKGGGFGMFSTIDSGAARVVQIELAAGSHDVRVTADDISTTDRRLRREVQLVKYSPSEHRLNALANRLLGVPLDQLTPAHNATAPVESVRITVWRYRHDRSAGQLVPEPWMSVQSGVGR